MSTEIKACFEGQRKKALELRQSSIKERKQTLRKLLSWIKDNKVQIHKAVYQDLKRPEVDIEISEIFPVITEIKHALNQLNRWTRPTPVASSLAYLGTKAEVQYEPKGRCLIISPWNYPFQLMCSPLVSCLAAGNTAIIKPSEHAPATSSLLTRMVQELFQPDYVISIEGGVPETQELLSLPFDHIFFTGSTTVGKIVMEAAAKNLSSVTLELGGKSPVIIDDSANIEDAAKKIIWGRFTNNGQTCIAPDYIFVQESKEQTLIESLKRNIQSFFDPDNRGIKNAPHYSRIINPKHTERLVQMLEDAKAKGAQVVSGGISDAQESFLEPTVLTNIPEDAAVWKEEIFGPILPVKSYKNIEEVIDHINQNEKPLSLYLFSRNKNNKQRISKETSAGTMVINDVVLQFAHPNLPFGGANHSGIGKSHGHYGFLEFSNQKSVLKQWVGWSNAMMTYPPYTGLKKKLAQLISKYL